MRTRFFSVFRHTQISIYWIHRHHKTLIEYIFIEKREDKRKWDSEKWIWKFNHWWSNSHVSFHFHIIILFFLSFRCRPKSKHPIFAWMADADNVDVGPYMCDVCARKCRFFILSYYHLRFCASESLFARTPNLRVRTEFHFRNGKKMLRSRRLTMFAYTLCCFFMGS